MKAEECSSSSKFPLSIFVDKMNHNVQNVIITDQEQGQRIDNYLLRVLKGVPKSHIYRIIRNGEVRLNKKRVKPLYKLQTGDTVRIPPVRMSDNSDEAMPASMQVKLLLQSSILYEDDRLLIINKPAGLAVHGGSGVNLGVIEILRQIYGDKQFLELAHRLDRDTSGCLVIAKKRSMLRQIHQLLRDRQAEKIYLALVKGVISKAHFTVKLALEKNILRSGERMVNVNAEGKPAVTHFKVLQRFKEASLVEIRLETGRTHQIRVHTQAIGHPVAGDEKYGDKDFNRLMKQYQCKRLFLHAKKLTLPLADYDPPLVVEAPLDPLLNQILVNLVKS